jgi:hypothetical protein
VSAPRQLIELEVATRAVHETPEAVRTTCSLARAERLLGREYHGRFLVELLQNAADAWREDQRSCQRRSRLHILVTEEPALLVANEGVPLTAEVVINSLGHIGASTKAEGEAIGHKGIGFKSVLELSDRPEIHSSLQTSDRRLAIRFDAQQAAATIRAASPDWDRHLAAVDNVDHDDPIAGIPVLRFPIWVAEPPSAVQKLADEGYDTVVRLPYVPSAGYEADDWLRMVHAAVDEVSDPIVLLLDSFEVVTIEDRTRRRTTDIRPDVESDNNGRQHVMVKRSGRPTSTWILERSGLNNSDGLASELAVGIRIAADDGNVVPAVEAAGSAPFHLFFPTHIPTGLPFLLHGYFQVNAPRTAFYDGSRHRNEAILAGLAPMLAGAVERLLADQPGLAVSLVNAVAACLRPEDDLAMRFQGQVLAALDEVAWIPALGADGPCRVRPREVLVLDELHMPAMAAFPAGYVQARLDRFVPDPALTAGSLQLLRERQRGSASDDDSAQRDLTVLGELLRPGDLDIWPPTEAVDGLVSVLDLLHAMRAADRNGTEALLSELRTDTRSRLVPTVADDRIELRPCAEPSIGRAGERSRVLMARVQTIGADGSVPLAPPPALNVEFLPDGALTTDDIARAAPLGVRPFTVDNLLDRLSNLEVADDDAAAVLRFAWRLLSREARSGFSIAAAVHKAAEFDPVALFWCQPGRARDRDTGAPKQARERNLTRLLVPCRDGSWRPAGEVVLGADWAEWLDNHAVGEEVQRARRVRALRALEVTAPDDARLLASPQEVAELLGPAPRPVRDADAHEDDDQTLLQDLADDAAVAEGEDEVSPQLWLLTFMLRIGVWQVLPIGSYIDRTRRPEPDRFPWVGAIEEVRQLQVAEDGGWTFASRPDRPHGRPQVVEDHRFLWSLCAAAQRDATALYTLLDLGAPLYRQASVALIDCHGCSDAHGYHKSRHESRTHDGFPSQLLLQLQTERWLPATRDGQRLAQLFRADEVWWGADPLPAKATAQHRERFLLRCDPEMGITEQLGALVRLDTIDTASLVRLEAVLTQLRNDLEGAVLWTNSNPVLTRQAYIGLHRQLYRRLADLYTRQPDEVAEAIGRVGVLCERGEQLLHLQPVQARHDDGAHAAHLRHFPDDLPRLALPRDEARTAHALGVPPLQLVFHREGGDDGRDVTELIASRYRDALPELLAILVHHSLGAETMEPTSRAFDERVRRLHRLRVLQVDRLHLDVEVVDTDLRFELGVGVGGNTFLDGATTASPVLYHDLAGDGWQERLWLRLAPHLVAMTESPAYEHTVELFLHRDTEVEREDFMLSLGVRPEDVDRLRERLGIASHAADTDRRTWFTAILRVRGVVCEPGELDLDRVKTTLTDAGLSQANAQRLVALGGTRQDRSDTSPDGALRTLVEAGVGLEDLHDRLRELGEPGLGPDIAARRFREWLGHHRWLLVSVLARSKGPEEAQRQVDLLSPPAALRFALDPQLEDLLQPVAATLEAAAVQVSAAQLAETPVTALAVAGGYAGLDELRVAADTLSDGDAYRRELRRRATQIRSLLLEVGILARITATTTRSGIRTLESKVAELLPRDPHRPSQLRDHLDGLLPGHPGLVDLLDRHIEDDVIGEPVTYARLEPHLLASGLPVDARDRITQTLTRPREAIEQLARRGQQLRDVGVVPSVPAELRAGPSASSEAEVPAMPEATSNGPDGNQVATGEGTTRKAVRAVTVPPDMDRRKKAAGDEGEQWALAATVRDLLDLDVTGRRNALEELVSLLQARFQGQAVERLLPHARRAEVVLDDDEEFAEHLAAFLHVSQVSDQFGFDLLGWLPPEGDRPAIPGLLEVKSSSSGAFHLSNSEWQLATELRSDRQGHHYVVLVVTRNPKGGPPTRMDLLPDPVGLVKSKQLQQDVDGYVLSYKLIR